MTRPSPPSGPDTPAPSGPGPTSAGPSEDMVQRFAALHVVADPSAPTVDSAELRVSPGGAPGAAAAGPRYTFEPVFASGGLGTIRRAFDHRLGRPVAVKELRTYQPGGASEARFLCEAQITAQLEHPAIVPVHDLGRHASGAPYYCMKLIDGESLDALVRARPDLPARLSLVPHVLAVADALAYAHDRGIIHRDLKPANVLVGPFGETVVIDWGLAKDLKLGDDPADARSPSAGSPAATEDLTRTGELVGTLPFMPLEQAEGKRIDARADVYAIGAILYFVLSGSLPYEGRPGLPTITAMLAGPPPDLAERVAGVPADLLAIVRKAMARAPADRYATAQELAADLRRFLDGRMVAARAYSPVDVLRHLARRHRAILGVAAAGLALLTGVGAYSYAQVVQQRREADDQRALAVTAREAEAEARTVAEAQALAARRNASRLLVEAGRDELFARQRPQQAAVLLAGAYRSDPDDVEVRTMLAEAMRGVDARRQTFAGHAGGVAELAHDGSGARLLARTGEGQVHLWDTRRGERIATIAVADDPIVDAVFAAGDDEVLTYTWGGELARWSVTDGRALGKSAADPVKSPRPTDEDNLRAFGPGTAMLSSGTDVRIVDVVSRAEIGRHGLSSPEARRIVALGGQPREFALLDEQRNGDFFQDMPFRIVHWDLRRGRVRTSPDLLRQDWLAIVASRDGRRVAFVRPDGESSIWDADSGAVVALGSCGPFAERDGDGAESMAFDAGGRELVRLVGDDQVARWDVETGACVRVSAPLGSDTERLRITPDGRQIVLAHAGAEVSLLDVETLSPRLRLLAHSQPIRALAVAPDSATFATGSVDGEVRVWAIDDPRVLHRVAVGDVVSDADDDGQLFALGRRHDGRKTEFSFMDQFKPGAVEPGGARDLLRIDAGAGGGAAPTSAAIAVAARAERLARRGSTLVASSAWGRSMELWSTDGEALGTLDFFAADGSSEGRSALSDDARHLWVSVSNEGGGDAVLRYGLPALHREHRSAVRGVWALAPQTARGVSLSGPGREPAWGSAYLLDLESGALVATIEGTSGNFSPAGDRLFMGHNDGAIRAYDAIGGQLLATLRPPETARFARMSYGPEVAVFSRDGALFATSRLDGTIDLWRAASLEPVREFKGHSSLVQRLQFSPDGVRLFSHGSRVADGDATAFLWRLDRAGGGVRLDIPDLSEARFSPDGRVLATGCGDGATRLWNTENGRLLAELRGHAGKITALEFSAAGDRLITAADDDSAIVWQLPLERRTPAQIDEILAERAPFAMIDGQVTRR